MLIALACLVLLSGGQSPSPNDGELERYRTETIVTLADGDRTVSSKVYTDCGVHYRRSFNTGGSISVSASGRNPFVALGDRSILILSDLPGCPGTKAAVVGETYQFDVNIPSSQIVDRRIRAPYAHARRYDNVDDARTVMLYSQQELFRGGIDGLRVTEAKLVVTERNPTTPLPDSFGDAFPWYKNTPRADVGSPDYAVHDHKSRFSGFIVELNQIGEQHRCDKFDREAEGPLLVEGDRWDTCPPWGGQSLGWLVARPSADLSRIDYSYNEHSTGKIATHYRATWLEARGAPGANEGENYFFWRPALCFDGQCFATHADRRGIWPGFRLYYPKKNQVIAVKWIH